MLQWRMANQSFKRLAEFQTSDRLLEPQANLQINARNDALILSNVTFEPTPGVRVLSDLSCTIEPGQHVALVGPSGCGKSTVMHLLLREIEKNNGSVSWASNPLDQTDFLALTREVGYVQQKPLILNDSLRNNLLLGLRRPSEKTIDDNNSQVDISRFERCSTLDDLNHELIKVVGDVGLTQDLIKRALDNPMPKTLGKDNWFQQCSSLIKNIRHNAELSKLYTPLTPKTIFPGFTLMENIAFSMISLPANQSQDIDELFDWAAKHYNQMDWYGELVQLGHKRFKRDKNLENMLEHNMPNLHKILTGLPQDTDGVIELNTLNVINSLNKRQARILAKIALKSPLESYRSILDEDKWKQLEALILLARQQVMEVRNNKLIPFDAKPEKSVLTLRELFLNGVVDGSVRGAFATIDRQILSELAEADLEKDLIIMGLESSAGEAGKALSGGQAMKLALARVLLKKPNMLMLDEVTAALDEKSQALIVDLIEKQYQGKTVISISHRLSTIKNYSNIFVFEQGSIVQSGTYGELSGRDGLFRELLQQQGGDITPLKTESLPEKSTEQNKAVDFIQAMNNNPIFAPLAPEHKELLQRVAVFQTCEKDDVLFERGDDGSELFILLEGAVDFLAPTDSDDRQTIDTFTAGASFGELALFGNMPRTLTAQASSDCRLAVMNREAIFELMQSCPEMAQQFLRQITLQLAQVRDELYVKKRKPLEPGVSS